MFFSTGEGAKRDDSTIRRPMCLPVRIWGRDRPYLFSEERR